MLQNRNALVTGSTSGIGLAIAEELANSGYNIILNGLGNINEINAIKNSFINKFEVKVIYSNANMSKSNEIEMMIHDSVKELGSIDILVNNAGIQHVAPIQEFPIEKWDQIIAINLSSAFHTIRSSIQYMQKNNWGRIVNIASAHGLVGSASKSAYVAAKHGIVGLTKVVALENAQANITCNTICPGWVKTPLVMKQIEDKAKANNISIEESTKSLLFEKQPSLKFVSPNEIGQMVCFLVSDAGNPITGTNISMDGGWTAC